MENYISFLKNSILFTDISETDLLSLLSCLKASKKIYEKNEYILMAGNQVNSIGIVLDGAALLLKEDFWGNRSIIGELQRNSLFAEALACLNNTPSEVSVIAKENHTTILFLQIDRVMNICTSSCSYHQQLLKNLITLMASKNVTLVKKLDMMSKKTIRDRLLNYLSNLSLEKNTEKLEIPFNRQELADYLSVDRSALSNEISKLTQEGILESNKNTFVLKKLPGNYDACD